MERHHPTNETEPTLRPLLEVDLSGGDALPFNLITMAMQHLEGDDLARFNMSIWLATQQGSGATYSDLLRIVDTHTDLVDTSNTFPIYGRQAKVMNAVDRLYKGLETLPEDVSLYASEVYPDFEEEGTGVGAYLAVLEGDILTIGRDLTLCDESQREQLQRYQEMLIACALSLRRYGT